MATSAVAREAVLSLRRTIAKIEGRPAERLVAPTSACATTVLRRGAGPGFEASAEENAEGRLATGAERLDLALDGGLPMAALTEIHGPAARDVGAASSFALALAGRLCQHRRERGTAGPVLWIGAGPAFAEAGFPYAPGLARLVGLGADDLLFCAAAKLADALWVAEEAARLEALSLVLVEVRGNSAGLDLTATRRLHRRAQIAGRPVLLLRQAAIAEPTAAPARLLVATAPAALRATLAGPMPGTLGHPAFAVTIGKGRAPFPGPFFLEWNQNELSFRERRPQDAGAVVPAPAGRADPAPEAGSIVAFAPVGRASGGPDRQPPRHERPADRGPRRAG
jgi:protein ImuA